MPRLVGVDIGGTNTDLVFVDTERGALRTAKVSSTPANQADGLIQGLERLGVPLGNLDLIVHGTTVATNAVLERKGARCGLITTAGFRDVLELRRRDRPQTYGLIGSFVPLIERRFRREVDERMSAEGTPLVPLDAHEVQRVAQGLRDDGCEVIVIAFLHAYANAAHERAAREAVASIWPTDYIVLSSEIMPAIREFERTSTAVVSGYVQPLIARYLERLARRLAEGGYRRELLIVQSNGGVMAAKVAPRFAANTILSGPAAGVTAGAAIATELGLDRAVSCDMGGTSFDACVIRDGLPDLAQEKRLDFGVPLCVPMLDADAVAAGGGSLARIDAAGILQVGPDSAGADPGPVAYGRGGTIPTITDANLVLGILSPDIPGGAPAGTMPLDRDSARSAIGERIAGPLGLTVDAAAEAIVSVATARMGGHIRRRLLEKGMDPRTFSMIAFGGAGPLHANRLIREVGLRSAIVPWFPGLTSALGCILGKLRHDFLQSVGMIVSSLDETRLASAFAELAGEGRRVLGDEGTPPSAIAILRGADMCYRGQTHVIQVPFPADGPLTRPVVRESFERAYRQRYGQLLSTQEIRLVNVRLTALSTQAAPAVGPLIRVPAGPAPTPEHARVYFGGERLRAAVWQRHDLPRGFVVAGPSVLLQHDSTCFIEPGYAGRVHDSGNLIIERAS